MTQRPFAATVTLIFLCSLGAARADDKHHAAEPLAQQPVTAAAKAYADAEAHWKAGALTGDVVGAWSVRWLEAQRALPLTGAALTAAIDEHLRRMQALEAVARQQYTAGTATSLDVDGATFFRAQAELWSSRAHAKNDDGGVTVAVDAGVRSI